MTFLSPLRLLLLVPVVAIGTAYVVQALRRGGYAARFTDLALLASVAPRRPPWWKRHLPAALLLLCLAALVLSLGRPARVERVPRERATVVLAIDVSNSMAAEDVEPTRLIAAEDGALAFVNQLPPRLNLGLVAFSGTASVLVSPTTDRPAVQNAIRTLELGPGTATGDAVEASLTAIKSVPGGGPGQPPAPGRIVLLSDGGRTRGELNSTAASAARQAGVPVSTIAYGTPDGTVTIQGTTIPVPVDEPALRALAQQTDGAAYRAETSKQLRDVYKGLGSSIGYDKHQQEVGRWFVGLALALGLVAAGLSVLWTSRLP
jgi:Ca-activated chloride channel family protein